MFGFVFFTMVIIYIFIGSVVRKAIKEEKNKKSNDRRYATINSHYSPQTLNKKGSSGKQATTNKPKDTTYTKDTTSAKDVVSTIVHIDMESASHKIKDDKYDWLSAQIAEEKRAYRKACAMFDFNLAADHHKRCDAEGIDTGIAKNNWR